MHELTIETPIHGRCLVEAREEAPLLIGFHGYAERAEVHLEELRRLPGSEGWTLVAVQALHPFYTRTGDVVANWMTSENRELAIGDNVEYVRRVVGAVRASCSGAAARPLVFIGFSQGASMAARAAAFSATAAGLILLGGDIPPDVKEASVALPPALVGRGVRDEWFTDEKFKEDLSYLQRTTRVTPCVFEGGHEWTDAFRTAAGDFLAGLVRS